MLSKEKKKEKRGEQKRRERERDETRRVGRTWTKDDRRSERWAGRSG